LLLLGLAVIVVLFSALWVVSVKLEDSSIADIAWGPAILVLALVYYLSGNGAPIRSGLTLALVAIWAIRLAVHLYLRNQIQGEDFRYEMLRNHRGKSWWWYSYFRVFLLQALVAWVMSIPIYFAIVSLRPTALTIVDYIGIAWFVIGFAFEAIGDEQLRRFRANSKNVKLVLESGLWRLTRHPNYFGEALLWWGFGLIGAATGGVVGLIAPALLMYFLMYISSMLLERSLKRNKPAYASYVATIPHFFPVIRKVTLEAPPKPAVSAKLRGR
jgi:steroid 5-alpha reductase family enzyme